MLVICIGLIEKGLINLANKIFPIFYRIIKNILSKHNIDILGETFVFSPHLIVQKCLPNIKLYLYYFANTPSYDI